MNEKHLLKEVIKDVSSQAKGQPTTLAMMSKANIQNARKAFSVFDPHKRANKGQHKQDSNANSTQEKANTSRGGSQDRFPQNQDTGGKIQLSQRESICDDIGNNKKEELNCYRYGHFTVSSLSNSNRLSFSQTGPKPPQHKYKIAFNGPPPHNYSLSTALIEDVDGDSQITLSGTNQRNRQADEKQGNSNRDISFLTKDGFRKHLNQNGLSKINHVQKIVTQNDLNKKNDDQLVQRNDHYGALSLASMSQYQPELQKKKKYYSQQTAEQLYDLQDGGQSHFTNLQDTDSQLQVSIDSPLIFSKDQIINMEALKKVSEAIPFCQEAHSMTNKKHTLGKKNVDSSINDDLAMMRERWLNSKNNSSNVSDKGIEIAMKTNDVFSSHQDNEEILFLHNNSQPTDYEAYQNTLNEEQQTFQSQAESARLTNSQIIKEPHVYSFRLLRSQSGTVTKYYTTAEVGTAQLPQDICLNQISQLAKRILPISSGKAINIQNLNESVVSEVRRQKKKYNSFGRVHNGKMKNQALQIIQRPEKQDDSVDSDLILSPKPQPTEQTETSMLPKNLNSTEKHSTNSCHFKGTGSSTYMNSCSQVKMQHLKNKKATKIFDKYFQGSTTSQNPIPRISITPNDIFTRVQDSSAVMEAQNKTDRSCALKMMPSAISAANRADKRRVSLNRRYWKGCNNKMTSGFYQLSKSSISMLGEKNHSICGVADLSTTQPDVFTSKKFLQGRKLKQDKSIPLKDKSAPNFYRVKQVMMKGLLDSQQALEQTEAQDSIVYAAGTETSKESLQTLRRKQPDQASECKCYPQQPKSKVLDQVRIPRLSTSSNKLQYSKEVRMHSDRAQNYLSTCKVTKHHGNGYHQRAKDPSLQMLKKFDSEENAPKHTARIASHSLQHSEKGMKEVAQADKKRASLANQTGQTYSTIIKFDSPRATTTMQDGSKIVSPTASYEIHSITADAERKQIHVLQNEYLDSEKKKSLTKVQKQNSVLISSSPPKKIIKKVNTIPIQSPNPQPTTQMSHFNAKKGKNELLTEYLDSSQIRPSSVGPQIDSIAQLNLNKLPQRDHSGKQNHSHELQKANSTRVTDQANILDKKQQSNLICEANNLYAIQSDSRYSEGQLYQQEEYEASRSQLENKDVKINVQNQKESSVSSPKESSNIFKSTIGNTGIYILGTEQYLQSAVGDEKFAANMLQTYWPYLSGFSTTAENSKAQKNVPSDTQRRPQTQQKSNHVPVKQFLAAEGVPFQQHRKLINRRRTSTQLKAWQNKLSRSRVGKTMSPLGAKITQPPQPVSPGVLGRRLSQTSGNMKNQNEKYLNSNQVSKMIPKEEEAIVKPIENDSQLCKRRLSQQMIFDVGQLSPSRGSTHRNSSSFIAAMNGDGCINQDQLRVIQQALNSSLDGRNTVSHVLGIVGDFASTFKEKDQNDSQNSRSPATRTFSISHPNQIDSKTQVCVYTFGDSIDDLKQVGRKNTQQYKNQQHNTRANQAEALLHQFRDEDDNQEASFSTQNIVLKAQSSQMSQNECEYRGLADQNEQPQCESVPSMIGRFQDSRDSPGQCTFYDVRPRGNSLDLKHGEIFYPQKPQTSHGKTRFSWQTNKKSIQSGSNILDQKRQCDQEAGFSNSNDKNQEANKIKTKSSKIAEAYMSYAMRISKREYPKERLGCRVNVTQEQATDTSLKVNSEFERNTTLIDSVTFKSDQMNEGASARYSSQKAKQIDYPSDQPNSQRLSMVNLVKSSKFDSQAHKDNPYSTQITDSTIPIEERFPQTSPSIDRIQFQECEKNSFQNYISSSKNDLYFPQKVLAANVNKIYSYHARRPFNIQQLQQQAKKQTKNASYHQQKQAEKQSLQKELSKSFYSGPHTQEGNTNNSQQNKKSVELAVKNLFTDNKPLQERIDTIHQESLITNELPTVMSVIGNLPSSRLQGKLSSRDELNQDDLLIIRGQLPSQTQHQSYLVKANIDNSNKVDNKIKIGAQIYDKQQMQRCTISPSTAFSGNKDLSHMQVKLVKVQPDEKPSFERQETTEGPPNLNIGENSLISTLHTTQNCVNANMQLMRNNNMQAQAVTTEGSAELQKSPDQSPMKSKCVDDFKILSSIATKQGHQTIKALDDKNHISFDQRSISTALMKQAEDDTPSIQNQCSSSRRACDSITAYMKKQNGFKNPGSPREDI